MYLFEHANKLQFNDSIQADALEAFIQMIWSKRKTNFLYKNAYMLFDASKIGKVTQRFLKIDRNNDIQAQNYVGLVQFEGQSIHFLPKLFYSKNESLYATIAQLSQIHLIWWLSYAQKIYFPFSSVRLNLFVKNNFNINEVLIFHFAQFCLQQLSQEIYQDFHTTNDSMTYIKGKIDINLYIKKNIGQSKYQIIPCQYETHSHQNLFNSIIKYVCLRLLEVTKLRKTQNMLLQIVAYFQSLPNRTYKIEDCEKVSINSSFEGWNILLDYCKMFLSNMQNIQKNSERKGAAAMAFLLPTESLFEEFVCGFLRKHFPELKMKYQDNSTFLAKDSENRPSFKLKQDLVIERNDGSLIILDMKYKLISIENGVAKGIAASDLYQMMAYAVRRKCREVILLYPCLLDNFETNILNNNNIANYYMTEEFSQTDIKISLVKVPFAICPSIFINLQAVSQQFVSLEKHLNIFFGDMFLI